MRNDFDGWLSEHAWGGPDPDPEPYDDPGDDEHDDYDSEVEEDEEEDDGWGNEPDPALYEAMASQIAFDRVQDVRHGRAQFQNCYPCGLLEFNCTYPKCGASQVKGCFCEMPVCEYPKCGIRNVRQGVASWKFC